MIFEIDENLEQHLQDMLIEEYLDEAFKEYKEGTTKYPAVNLKPKDAVPQAFGFNLPGNDKFMLYLASYTDKGTKHTPTKLRPNEVIAQAIPLSLSDKGSLIQLKGGLGTDPIGAISSIFDTVYETCVAHNIKGVMFRFPVKKMKGQGAVLTRVMTRLVRQKTGGRFEVLPTPMTKGSKYAFVFIVNKMHKEKVLDKLSVDLGEFEEIKIKGFPVYKDKATGKEVTKEEAKLKSVTKKINKIPETTVPKVTIKRTDLVKLFNNGATADATMRRLNVKDTGELSNTSNASQTLAIDNKGLGNWIKELVEDYSKGHFENNSEAILDAIHAVPESEWAKATDHKELFKIVSNIIDKDDTSGDLYVKTNKIFRYIDQAMTAYYTKNFNKTHEHIPDQLEDALEDYTGAMYADINDALRGLEKPNLTVLDIINKMDEAFLKHGEILPKGITLYRGQKIPGPVFKNVIETEKTFYFANYVSTSLKPIMFSNGIGSVEYKDIGSVYKNDAKGIDAAIAAESPAFRIGLVISDTHKTKCINCIGFSGHPRELEILLPRGTVIKFNKMVDGGKGAYLAYVSIATDSVLNEEIYDGDLFFETGEVKPITGFKFSNIINEKKKEQASNMDKVLASIINFDDMSPKFFE